MHLFRSRVSVFLVILLLLSLLPALLLHEDEHSMGELAIAYSILFGSIGLVLFLLFSMRYAIDEKYLHIKVGPKTYQQIAIDDIQRVERSYNPLSSPAASLKRLYIKAKGRDALISPVREEEFIRLLKARNPNIEVKMTDHSGWWRFWDWDI